MSVTLDARPANDVLEQILAVVRDVRSAPPETEVPRDLLGSRFLSSLQAVELIVRLERRFRIRFGTESQDFTTLRDVEALAALVLRRAHT